VEEGGGERLEFFCYDLADRVLDVGGVEVYELGMGTGWVGIG